MGHRPPGVERATGAGGRGSTFLVCGFSTSFAQIKPGARGCVEGRTVGLLGDEKGEQTSGDVVDGPLARGPESGSVLGGLTSG